MPNDEHWFADFNIVDGLRLMRAFTKMSSADQSAFINMAEGRAGTARNFVRGTQKPERGGHVAIHRHGGVINPIRSPRVVKLGVPDDYTAYLPRIIRGFSAAQPDVGLELQCQPTGTLVDMVDGGSLDIAIVTRGPHRPEGDTLRYEPLIWVSSKEAGSRRYEVLPLATFQHGCSTRRHSIEALAGAGRAYEIVLSSPSLTGVLQPVKSGIAVAAIPRCSISDDLSVLGNEHDLPALPALELTLAHGAHLKADVEALADVIRGELTAA